MAEGKVVGAPAVAALEQGGAAPAPGVPGAPESAAAATDDEEEEELDMSNVDAMMAEEDELDG